MLRRPPSSPRTDSLFPYTTLFRSGREVIGPHDVNDRVVQRFLVDLEAQKGKRAFDKAQAAIYAWEWLQAASASWPQQKLSRLYRSEERRVGTECVNRVRSLWAQLTKKTKTHTLIETT